VNTVAGLRINTWTDGIIFVVALGVMIFLIRRFPGHVEKPLADMGEKWRGKAEEADAEDTVAEDTDAEEADAEEADAEEADAEEADAEEADAEEAEAEEAEAEEDEAEETDAEEAEDTEEAWHCGQPGLLSSLTD